MKYTIDDLIKEAERLFVESTVDSSNDVAPFTSLTILKDPSLYFLMIEKLKIRKQQEDEACLDDS